MFAYVQVFETFGHCLLSFCLISCVSSRVRIDGGGGGGGGGEKFGGRGWVEGGVGLGGTWGRGVGGGG